MISPIDFDERLRAWSEFIEHQEILPSVSPMIASSWRRCWARLNPYSNATSSRLSADNLLAMQVAGFDLLSLARPVMEDVYQYIESSDSAILLTNSAGYVLDMLGDQDMLEAIEAMGVSTGALLSENQVGTIAFSLAISERLPARVIGAEHYLKRFHELVEAVAPIFDLSGRPLAALGVINFVYQHHPHSLGLVVAGARAVENQLQADFLLREQHSHLAQLNAILAANSDGILVWNADNLLMQINPVAARQIGLPIDRLYGRGITEFVSFPNFIQDAIDKRELLTDVEANLRVGGRQVSCVLSLRFVLDSNQELQWTVVTLREAKDVHQLVQRQVGAHASLTLDDLPGESPEMQQVHRFVRAAAPAKASILIRGESGTGKTVLASAIHNESPRRDGPFIIFACSTVPGELMVSELLGYEEGFSAKRPGGRPSKFELAQAGSIFFQDIDVLSLEAQAVLINAIDLSIVQRLGSDRPVPIDVRIIAASDAPMEKLIAQGNFRADLFYRLASFSVKLPPLRHRSKDLPLLVDRILARQARQLKRPLSLGPGVLELLIKYPWPGNIRELEAVLARSAIQAGVSQVIGPMHLPEFVREPASYHEESEGALRVQPLSEMERELLLLTVQACHGNVSETARRLGVGRTTIWRKLKEFHISPDDFRERVLDKSLD